MFNPSDCNGIQPKFQVHKDIKCQGLGIHFQDGVTPMCGALVLLGLSLHKVSHPPGPPLHKVSHPPGPPLHKVLHPPGIYVSSIFPNPAVQGSHQNN